MSEHAPRTRLVRALGLIAAIAAAAGALAVGIPRVSTPPPVAQVLPLLAEPTDSSLSEEVDTLQSGETLSALLGVEHTLAAPEGAKISDVAWQEVVSVAPTADREEVARITSEYDLVAVPVVDTQGRVLGVVTVDDVIDVIQEEQT